jgi:hypothetical protein
MRGDHSNEQAKGEVQRETGEALKGPKPQKFPQQQQKDGSSKQMGGKSVSESSQQLQNEGDERTPEKPIGEVDYANRDPAKKKTGEF